MRTTRWHPGPVRRLTLLGLALSTAAVAIDAQASPSDGTAAVEALQRPATRRGPTASRSDAGNEHGTASYYSKHLSGRRTASGQSYDPDALTAAHRTLPLGTRVRVVNPKNDHSVVVTINDRGPIPKNRVIDVSSAAADQLGMKKAGVTKVDTQVVGPPDKVR